MRSFIAAVLAVALVAVPASALAQAQRGTGASPGQQRPVPGAPQAGARAETPAPAPADLGIDINRIRKELREIPPVKSALLRYDFHVDVYGQNPKIDFFKDFDLSPNGAVRYGGMTHSEFMDVVTPQAYKAPTADVLGLAMFAVQQMMKKRLGDNGGQQDK
jgi:hypothetical protein